MKKKLFALMLCIALTSGCVYAESAVGAESAVSTESTVSTESNSDTESTESAESTESTADIESTVRADSVESTEGIKGDESTENAESTESTGSMQAEKEDGRETIGIISAMDTELKLLLENAQIDHVDHIGNRDYYVGELCGVPVVLQRLGIGKVRAASGTATLLDRYDVSEVIFTGVAGGVSDETEVMDIVVATDLLQHDYGVMTDDGFIWTGAQLGTDSVYPCDEELVEMARESAVEVLGEDHVFTGTVVSGDQFVSSAAYVKKLQEDFDAMACEMEGAAVAIVCSEYGVPFVVIRSMSDKADGKAVKTYENFMDIAADHSSKIVMDMLQDIHDKGAKTEEK